MACRSIRHLLAALLVLLSLATGAAAAVQVRVVPVPATAAVGATVTVTVEADSVADLGGFQFAFVYSTTDLQAVAATVNPAFDQVVAQDLGTGTGSGMIAATVFNNSPLSGTPVTLATIDFKILTPVTSAIGLANVVLGQVGGTEIPSAAAGGTIVGSGADTTPPTDGTLAATPGPAQNSLSWSGFSDTGSGVASYRLVFDTSGSPADCTAGTQIYSGIGTSYPHAGLVNGTAYYYRVCAVDNAGNTSPGTTALAVPAAPSFTVIFASGGNGTVTGLTPQAVPFGGSVATVTANPAAGYHFVNWTGTGGFVTSTSNPLIVTNVTADMSISANFAQDLDTSPPTVDTFVLPATATSLTVAVTSFAASDNVGVTRYLLSESPTQPLATDPGWAPVPAGSHTFATQGSRTLYAFAGDAAGNVSAAFPATVTITLSDTTPPTVDGLILPATSPGLTVAVTGFTASDNVGVSGYLLNESPTQPQLTDPAWSMTPPTSYTFAAQGARTLYAFARDAAGNVSAAFPATVTIALPDTAPPTVDGFALPAASASLTVTVTSLTASDNVGVTGYLLGESPAQPQLTDPAWTAQPPVSYAFATQGARTLYAFARDAAGNVSAAFPATVTIALPDTTPPTVDSFALPATAASLTVPLLSFAASDNFGVTRYLLSESPTQPSPLDPAWTTTPSASYTFAAQGSRTLYAFAGDAAGNISAAAAATVTIAVPDTTPPTVDSFILPATATSLTVPLLSFTASDNVGVAGYFLSEAPTQPPAGDPAWTPTPSASYTFAAQGARTLYASARDAAGNVSTALSAAVTITLPDTTPPRVESFVLPATATSLTVPVVSFTASDNAGVAGYLLSVVATPPSAGDPAWTPTPPASFTFATPGVKPLYAFARDGAGNVSAALAATVTITLAETFAVTVTPGANGTISGPATFTTGGTPTYAINPASGYHVAGVTVNGTSVGAVSSYTVPASMVGAVTIAATFALNTFTITADAGSDGSITPSGAVAVPPGGSISFTIKPTAGYYIADVLVDGVSAGAVTSYTFTNVSANHTIQVVYGVPDGRLDPNGSEIGIGDCVLAMRIALGDIEPTPEQKKRGDCAPLVNGKPVPDGKIDLGDAVVILRKVVGLETW
jgi:uncharacterized repeat protein (TIGR02543 family)